MNFNERLRSLRISHGLTQADLSKELHYGYTAISNYESGRNEPSISDLKILANYFEVSLDYLLGLSDNPLYPPSKKIKINRNFIQLSFFLSKWFSTISDEKYLLLSSYMKWLTTYRPSKRD